ncbi:hypothetical protein GCM10020000_30730 [Streptomyces olivoverticillatus]
MPPADTGASVVVQRPGAFTASSLQSSSDSDDTRLLPGGSGYRRMSFALFAAGVATFALLYSTQALLPAISAGLGVAADEASWTVSAATGGLALAVVPLSALSERYGRRQTMTVSLCVAAFIALLVPFAPDLGWLTALRAVQGAALAGVPASAMAYLAEEVRPKALVGAIGLFVAGNSIGGMTGRILARLGGAGVGLAGRSGRGRRPRGRLRGRFPPADPQGAPLLPHRGLAAGPGPYGRSATSPIRCCGGCTRSVRSS